MKKYMIGTLLVFASSTFCMELVLEKQKDIINQAEINKFRNLSQAHVTARRLFEHGAQDNASNEGTILQEAFTLRDQIYSQMQKNQRYQKALHFTAHPEIFRKTATSLAYDKISENTPLEFPCLIESDSLQFGINIYTYLELNKCKKDLTMPILVTILLHDKIEAELKTVAQR